MTGDIIKELRNRAGISQDKLCDYLGIEQSTLANYENNRRTPKNEMLVAIADYFDVTTDYLLGRTDEPTTQESNPLDADTTRLVKLYHGANEQAQKTAVLVLEQGQQKPNLKIVPREPAYIEREAVAFEGEVKRSKATPEQSAEVTRLRRIIEEQEKNK